VQGRANSPVVLDAKKGIGSADLKTLLLPGLGRDFARVTQQGLRSQCHRQGDCAVTSNCGPYPLGQQYSEVDLVGWGH
jgi:hypothetical protein